MPGQKLPANRSPFALAGVGSVAFGTLSTEAANARTQSVVVKDGQGKALVAPTLVTVYLAAAASGIDVVASAASGGLAAGTNGKLIATVVTGKVAIFQTDATGNLDITITDASARTLYLAVVLADGTVSVTSAVFA